MGRIWSCGLLLALTGCVSAAQGTPGAGVYTYDDVLKPHGHGRGEAAEQAATRICDRGNSQNIGLPAFDACMRGRGWRLAHFEPAPESSYASSTPTPTSDDSSNAAQAAIDMANQQAAMNASNAAAQQMNDAANAAALQAQINGNAAYWAPN
jgi:hypothetical protein